MKKTCYIERLFMLCWLIFFISLCLCMKLHIYAKVMVAGVTVFGALCLVYTLGRRSSPAVNLKHIAGILLLIHFMLMLFLCGQMKVVPGSDAGVIWYSAADIVEKGSVSKVIDEYASCAWSTQTSNNDYLLIYANSQFLVQCLIPIAKILHAFGVPLRSDTAYYCLNIINSLLIITA